MRFIFSLVSSEVNRPDVCRVRLRRCRGNVQRQEVRVFQSRGIPDTSVNQECNKQSMNTLQVSKEVNFKSHVWWWWTTVKGSEE